MKSPLNTILLFFVFHLGLLLGAAITPARLAVAAPPKLAAKPLPARMTADEAVDLDSYRLAIGLVLQRAQDAIRPINRKLQALCDKYKIDRTDLDTGAVSVNSDGTITRQAAVPGPELMKLPTEKTPVSKAPEKPATAK
jgi:hypothetical protein